MHVLVTGGGGFLGRAIVEQSVARGDRVRSLARGTYPQLAELGVECVRGDVSNPAAAEAACRGVECVIHTAAIAGVRMQREPYDRINLNGTQNIIAACRAAGVPRLVYTSSPSVTFAGEDQRGVDESAPLAVEWLEAHRSWYSASKARAEAEVLAANGPELATCALRPHLIWGPRDNHLVPRLIDRARRGRLRRVGDGANLVDMIYVDNAAAAHLLAADALARPDSLAAGKAYFLSQGEPVNCWQWIDEILALAELPPVGRSISYGAARRIGAACEAIYRLLPGREPPMTRFVAAQLAKSHWFDISAARSDLGYEPAVSTALGMQRLGEWLRLCAGPPGH
ncbi:MAG: NAD-dependent epimerase/dehydratase family protein [Planctomycetales bacterium]|nr:NAD-dependent epimerase/dehydratase family protein [Planctomycetales bacterium]